MTTYVEQYFLYGEEVASEAPLPGTLETLLAYADLTAGAAIVFAAFVLFSLAVGCLGTLSPFVFTRAKKRVLSSIRAVLSLLGGYSLELVRSVSSRECRRAALPALRELLTRWIVDNRPYRLASTVVNWHFPWNRPLATLCRLFGTYAGGLTVYTGLLVPTARYFSGIVDGWNAQIQSPYCPGVISRYYLDDRLSRHHFSEAYYCLGEKTGLRLYALVVNDWQLHLSDDGEINHFYPIAFVAITISLAIVATVSCNFLPETAAFQHVKSSLLLQNPYPLGTPISQKEIDLWNMINQYEADLDTKKTQLANKTVLLTKATAELSASKIRQEEGWAQFERLVSGRNEAVEAQSHELSINSHLRQQLIKTGGQLRVAEGRLRDERQKLTNVCQQVADERKQLENERRKLELECQHFSDDQKQANEHQDLVEERQRLDGVRDQLADEHQRLANEQEKHTEQHEEFVNNEHNLASENLDLMIRNSELTNSLQAIQQERYTAMARVMDMQRELESTNLTANITLVQAQESLSQTQQTEAAFNQSMSDLRSACDQAIMQEHSAADAARRQVSSLTAVVNDLQSKIGLAMRDAQRGHEQAVNSQRTIEILEHRLAKCQNLESGMERGSTQEIPKRQIGNTGSMSTALAEKEVVVANQLAEISGLKRRLEQAKQGSPRLSDSVAQENSQKLRAALEKERRERTTDNVRWSTKARQLETDNQKLRISLSNAEAQSCRRSGTRRPPTVP